MSAQTQIFIRIILTLAFLAVLSACGSSSSGSSQSTDLGSNGVVTKPIAQCNKVLNTSWGYKIAAQISGAGFDPNWANLFLSNVPTGFEAGTSYIQFFKGQAVNDSTISYANGAIQFALYDRQAAPNGAYLNNGAFYTSLKWDDIKNLIPGSTPATFIRRVIIILSLQDPQALYQVLSAGSYNVANNTNIDLLPSLIPTFYANPADYAVKSNGLPRETVLRNMHPLRNSTSGYDSLANSLCM